MSKALCVATRCTTKDQFVESFYRFCDEHTFFVATLNQRPIGLETPFSINLADRTPMLRGLCVVLEAWATPANPFGRPGIKLGIKRLTAGSEDMFARLARRRGNAAPTVAPTPPPIPAPAKPVIPPIPARATAASERYIPPTIPNPLPEKPTAPPTPPSEAVQAVPDDPPTMPVSVPDKPLMPVVPSVVAQIEQRTPGSDIVLPANPLMNLSDESLEGFVDCTVYEETGNFFQPELDPTTGEPLAASDPVEPPPPDFAPMARRPTPPSPTSEHATAHDTASPQAAPVDEAIASAAQSYSPDGGAPHDAYSPGASAPADYGYNAYAQSAPPAYYAPAGPVDRASGLMAPIARGKRRTLAMAGGAAALSAIVVFAIVQSSSSASTEPAKPTKVASAEDTKRAEPTAPAVSTTPAASAAPAAKSTAATPPPGAETMPVEPVEPAGGEGDGDGDESDDGAPPPSAEGPPLVGTGPCRLDVTTTPAGTKVVVDGKEIGPSPISIAGPCAKHKVELIHPRYKQDTRFVALAEGTPKKLDVTLIRPTHHLVIKTNPPGATISIQGRRAGTSPATVALMGFSGIDVTISRQGYETVTKRVYSKTPNDKLVVSLKRYKW